MIQRIIYCAAVFNGGKISDGLHPNSLSEESLFRKPIDFRAKHHFSILTRASINIYIIMLTNLLFFFLQILIMFFRLFMVDYKRTADCLFAEASGGTLMEFHTVLFDFDGTLANTLPLTIHGMQFIFEKFDNRTLRGDEIVAMFGPPEDGMIAENFQHKDKIDEAIDCYFSIYEKEHRAFVENNPDVQKLLRELNDQHIPVGVITGKSRRAYLLSEKALGFEGFFRNVIAGEEVAAPKPDPQGILRTLELFQADPASSIYIGDSNIDVLAGKAAGIHTAAVQWLPVSQSSHFPAAPDYCWAHVSQFIDLLKKQRV